MSILRPVAASAIVIGLCAITACSSGDAPQSTTSSGSNTAVVANAGPDQSVFIGTFVTLNGGNSTNADANGLTYAWTLQKPAGSKAVLSNPGIVNPTFTADVGGTYVGTLVVTDAQNPTITSAPSATTVTASGKNPPPVANAGPNQSVTPGKVVVLDGGGSSDPNGDPLTFRWKITGTPTGSSVPLLDATSVEPTFTPKDLGTYTVQLIVNDGVSDSTPSFTTIAVAPKALPTADAGTDQFVVPNTGSTMSSITLNGTKSHTNPAGDPLTYKWTFNSQPAGAPTVTIKDADKAIASFAPPVDVAGTYVAQLVVVDVNNTGSPNSAIATVKIVVSPIAKAKIFKLLNLATPLTTCDPSSCVPGTVQTATQLQFDATGSLVQPLTYTWQVASSPAGASFSFSSTSSATPTFVPNAAASYTITLTVADLAIPTHQNTRSFTIIAKAGPVASFSVSPSLTPPFPSTINLTDTSAGSNLSRAWAITRSPTGSTASLASTSALSTNFTPDKGGAYDIKLTITDTSDGAVDTKSQTITATTLPTVTPSSTRFLNSSTSCTTINLTAAVTDHNNISTGFTYSWAISSPSGISPLALDQPATVLNNSFTVKESEPRTSSYSGNYTGSLTATETISETPPPSISVSGSAPITIDLTDISDGHALYHSGIPGVTSTSKGCVDCHQAGNHDTTPGSTLGNSSGPDLKSYDAQTILDELNEVSPRVHSGAASPNSKTATRTQADHLAAFFATVGCLNSEH